MTTVLPTGVGSEAVGPAPGLSPVAAVRERYARLYAAATGTGDTAGTPGTTHTTGTPGAPAAGAPWPGAAGALPPYLCRLLNRAAPTGRAARGPYAVLGTDGDPLVPVGTGPLRLRYADGIAPQLLDAVGLGAFRAVRPGPKTTARLAEAADTLPALLPDAAAAVDRYITALVLLKPRGPASPMGDTMTSCAFYGLPFTAFVSGLGLHHMVPGFMFSEPSVYTLQESLYHEALRLALNEERRLVDHFASRDDRVTLVYVSWQSEWRTAEHCLRILYVYAQLARLRAAALRRGLGPEQPVLAEALRSVLACARELANSLAGMRYLFTDTGLRLLDGIEALLPECALEASA
ncbi:hypothetical protein ACX6XY_08670 [Streptomyces sp. O3]